MDAELQVPEAILQPLFEASNSSSTLNEALQSLIGFSRTDKGRSELSSKHLLLPVLQLVQSLSRPSAHHLLLLSLRLLRNLCAGEVLNQNSFIDNNGIEVISNAINVLGFDIDDSGCTIMRTALQVIANVSLAGENHQYVVWNHFVSDMFLKISRIRRREICDPLCMIIYTCCNDSTKLFSELCTSSGMAIMAEIVRTASEGDSERREIHFTKEQAFLLRILSEILNERLKEIRIGSEFSLSVLGIFQNAVKAVDFYTRGKSGLPTGVPSIDVLGYSLTILRDVCAQGSSSDSEEISEDVVDSLVSRGILDLLLSLLREMELPSSIRKTIKLTETQALTSQSLKVCPYKGFRRDMVAVIANCLFGKKNVQDHVREKNGIILLLQQCVLDEDNPFLREWGVWCASNLLQGNAENQKIVADLEMQGTVEVPELAKLGLRVEIDPNTKLTKLVNIT
ncbi:Ataxin-10 [Bienertia sinuspersici]